MRTRATSGQIAKDLNAFVILPCAFLMLRLGLHKLYAGSNVSPHTVNLAFGKCSEFTRTSYIPLYFQGLRWGLTLSPLNKLSSDKLLVCFNFQNASMSPKIGGNVVCMSKILDLSETPSYSASHPDPSCLHMALQLCLAG